LGGDEFIELVNISSSPVSLDDWALAGAVDYGFSGVSLAPGEHLIVAPFDPAMFHAKYSISSAVQIVGPYLGVLDDDDPNGESVELYQPGDGVAALLVDRVRYFATAPWPVAASNFGLSLVRRDASAYGNDVANWAAGIAGGTPGIANIMFDPTPPSQPGPPSAEALADGSVRLSWTPAADPDSEIGRYRVYRNEVELLGFADGTTFVDTSAALNIRYTYSIVAENTSGVVGPTSDPAVLRIFTLDKAVRADETHFRVNFSEPLSISDAHDLSNYFASNTTLLSAVLESGGNSVLLETATPILEGAGYRLVIDNLAGATAGSMLLPQSQRIVIPGFGNALLGEYYDDPATDFQTPPESAVLKTKIAERFDPSIYFIWLNQPNPYSNNDPPFLPTSPLPVSTRDTIAVRWTGRILAPTTGLYTFSFTISRNDGIRFWIDDDDDGVFEDILTERIVDAWPAAASPQTGTIDLIAGRYYDVRVDFFENVSTAQINMNWQHPGQTTLAPVPTSSLFTPGPAETARPSVTRIKLGSSHWTTEFLSQLEAAGVGSGGIEVPLGGTSDVLPWVNLNQVSMTFDEDVHVVPNSLLVSGVNAANYGVIGVDYDYATYTATWTLANPLPNDRVTLSLTDSTTDLVGNTVEETSATLLVLPGDINRDGATDAADFRASLDAQFRGIGSPGYSVLLDTDGNGAINIQDWQNVQVAIGDTIPSPSPAAAPGAVIVSGNTSRPASDRPAGAASLRTNPAARLSHPAVDRIVSTRLDSSARTLRANRRPRISPVNPAAIDDFLAVS
jgi:hypothetical protein